MLPSVASVMTSLRALLAPPRRLVGLFLLVTLLPSLLLIAFGWRLLQQDRELERQQVEVRREAMVDLAVSTLEGRVASTELVLRSGDDLGTLSTLDSVVIQFRSDEVETVPPGRLLYLPQSYPGPAIPAGALARGEELEHREQNPRAAADWFRRLAASPDEGIRAAALFAYARNLRKTGAHDEALNVYRTVAAVRDVAIEGMPAGLLSQAARCSLLLQLNRTKELAAEARELRTRLLRGDWRLDRPTFELNLQQANEWAGDLEKPTATQVALAAVVNRMWEEWRSGGPASSRRSVLSGGTLFTVLAQRDPSRLVALVAGPEFAGHHWTTKVVMLNPREDLQIGLHDAGFRGSDLPPSTRRRSAAETGLPWTVVVQDSALAETNSVSGRRTLWLTGLVVLAALVAGGTYAVGRAVSRELAVARLQADFVAAVSHEFRTPLTSLRQLSEMLLDRPHAPERTRAYYEALQRQTERLHRLVEALLDFGRMEAGTSPYRLRQLDAGALVSAVVEDFRVDPAARGHVVTAGADPDALVRADPDALTNAFWNLLDNAAKYSPGGEAIRVDVRVDRDEVVISVQDRGFGVPPEEQRDIWGRFVRGSRAKAEGIAGTGIGLAMVQHIVTAHDGRVGVASEPGSATTFSIWLPLVREVADERAQAWLES